MRRRLQRVAGVSCLGWVERGARAALWAGVFFGSGPMQAGGVPVAAVGNVTAEAQPLLDSAVPVGFSPMKWTLKNAHSTPLRVSVDVERQGHNMKHSHALGYGTSYEWVTPARGAVTQKILFPVSVLNDGAPYSAQLHASIRAQVGPVHMALPTGVGSGSSVTMPAAFSQSLRLDEGALSKDFMGGAAHVAHANPDPMKARFEGGVPQHQRSFRGATAVLEDFPAEPRAFAGLAAFWVSEEDWKRASQPLQESMLEWVRAGGNLFVVQVDGTRSFASSEADALLGLKGQAAEESRSWGMGRIVRQKGWKPDNHGRIKRDLIKLDASPFAPMAFDYAGWRSELTKSPRLRLGWLVTFLLGFAVLAAPVNLYLIAPRNKRHRLFVSVPILSLGAVGALMGFILLNEGAGGTGIRNGLLLVEPGAGNSILYQEQISRTGMVAQSGFSFPEDAVFMWVPGEGRTDHSVSLLRQGNMAAGGWFVSRAVQAHIVQRWIPSRAEVVLRQETGAAPALVSSVNHVMGPVFYVDEAKHYWKAGELAPGNPVVMEKATPEEFSAWYAGVFEEPSANLKARAKQVGERPGWFYAKAEAAPDFWIATSPQIRWARDQMLCCGPVKAPALNSMTEAQP